MRKLLRPPAHEVPEKFTQAFERGVRSTMKRILRLLREHPGLSFLELVDLLGEGTARRWWPPGSFERRGLMTSRAVKEPKSLPQGRGSVTLYDVAKP
jgi:DNA-binding transcriptional ArsR family regulator